MEKPASAASADQVTTAKRNFCNLYPRFLETTETVPSPNRLNTRHRAIIEWNADVLRGYRVLDIASHDGRWSFAALKTGACHVTGIEARPHLVDKAVTNFSFYGIPATSYRFITDMAVSAMRALPEASFDVVMCLGFLYHTMEHMAILLEARRLATRHVILDTDVTADGDAVIRLRHELIEDTRNSVDYGRTGQSHALVGKPSRGALIAMLEFAGYGVELFDWQDGTINDWSHIEDYRDGMRVTLRASRR
jgi:ubiquinone/menaquinone biosynthesis C-methylase UbiE